MALSIKAIRYFSVVAETASISAAIQSWNVSQAAVTEAIQRLESHLGALLFRRHARGMALTHAGLEILRHCQSILSALEATESALPVRPDALQGDLTIGVVSPLTGYYLPSLLERYRRNFPRVEVRITEESNALIEHLIIIGEIDLALIINAQEDNSQPFHTLDLASSPWRLWLAANHRLAGAGPVALRDLAHEAVIALRNEELGRVSGDFWRRAGVRPNVTVITRSVEAARSLIATGNDIAVLPHVLCWPWSLEGARLVAQPLQDHLAPLSLRLLWRRRSEASAATRAFITTAAEHQASSRLGLPAERSV